VSRKTNSHSYELVSKQIEGWTVEWSWFNEAVTKCVPRKRNPINQGEKMTAISANEATLGALLWDNQIYQVPPYQRNYSWERENTVALWNDLLRTAYSDESYFLGSLVFVRTNAPMVFDVLDGQQRFSSLMLLVAAFKSEIVAADPLNNSLQAINQVLMKVDVTGAFGGDVTPHIRLNEQDRVYFDRIVTDGTPATPQHKSQRKLSRAYKEFRKLIRDEAASRNLPIHQLWAAFQDALLNRLYVIRITAETNLNAQQVFQALNSSGMELSQADLVKNYLLMSAPPQRVQQILSMWADFAQTIGDDNLTSYIRAFWNSSNSFVRTADLYKALTEKVVCTPQIGGSEIAVTEFVSSLQDEAQVYYSLRDPDPAYWGNTHLDLVRDLSDLKNLKAQMIYVPLLAAAKVFENDRAQFTEVVRWFLKFYVRHTIVGGRAANELEKVYSQWAIEIRSGALSMTTLRENLIRMSPNDAEFLADLRTFAPSDNKVAQILLARINDSVNADNAIRRTVTSGGAVHVEHIIPKNPEPWQHFLDEQGINHEDVVDRFGNLTLLLGPRNQQASNRPFLEKRFFYEANGQPEPLNEMLVNLEIFGMEQLDARQNWLATQASELWAWD